MSREIKIGQFGAEIILASFENSLCWQDLLVIEQKLTLAENAIAKRIFSTWGFLKGKYPITYHITYHNFKED